MIRLAAGVLAAAVCSAALAQAAPRAYAVPGRGKVELQVPVDWYDDPRPRTGGLPSVRFFNRLGPRPPLDVTITIAWSTSKQPSYLNPQRLRAFVAQSAEDVAAAPETRPDLRELEGASGIGYYFRATIKSPLPDQWPNLTQGAIVVGDLLVTFTIVTADPAAPGVERALKMLQSARRVP